MLWIAFELVSSSYWKQPLNNSHNSSCVVNCFRTCIFVILKTTHRWKRPCWPWLWIAFELVSSSYWKQQTPSVPNYLPCCELLSNLYLRHIENNKLTDEAIINTLWIAFELVSSSYWKQHYRELPRRKFVVNCFRTCIFVILKTTCRAPKTQLHRCELLSNLYLRHIENNMCLYPIMMRNVVNCFRTCIFVILKTTVGL